MNKYVELDEPHTVHLYDMRWQSSKGLELDDNSYQLVGVVGHELLVNRFTVPRILDKDEHGFQNSREFVSIPVNTTTCFCSRILIRYIEKHCVGR